MDSVSTAIIDALSIGMQGLNDETILGIYQALTNIIKSKFGPKSTLAEALERLEKRPDSYARQAVLQEEILNAKANEDADIVEIALRLQQAVEKTTKKSDLKSLLQEKKEDSRSIRGALKLEVSTSTPLVSAGSEFSIYVVIKNPFTVPVTIYGIETHIPIELSDEIWRKRHLKEITEKRSQQFTDISLLQSIRLKLKFFIHDLIRIGRQESGPRVAEAVGTEFREDFSFAPPQATYHTEGGSIAAAGERGIAVGGYVSGGIDVNWNFDFQDMDREEAKSLLWDINEYIRGRQPSFLQPGNSVVKHFILKTNRWLTFTPIAHTFQIQVRYEVDGQMQVDTVPFEVNIRAAITSTLIGATVGSVLGALVKTDFSNPNASVALWRVILTSAILGFMIIVAFARKSNVQQLISVEDFWGGLFIGFLVGYSGEGLINSVFGSPIN